MPPITLSLAAGDSLSGRAFAELYRAFNQSLEEADAIPAEQDTIPVDIVVHVSGSVTDWGAPDPSPIVRHKKPASVEISVVIPRADWEDQSRETHREVLISRVASAIEIIAGELEGASNVNQATSLRSVFASGVDRFREWPIPEDALLGPPNFCPRCGERLPNRNAQQCRSCGADWHEREE